MTEPELGQVAGQPLVADGTCRTCGAPIAWAHTRHGERLPVDPEPVAGGNLVVGYSPGVGRVVVYTQATDRVLHLSHFATCPDAARWRRKAKR